MRRNILLSILILLTIYCAYVYADEITYGNLLIFGGDLDIRDDTPHLFFWDNDTNTGLMQHLEEDASGAPWQGFTWWDIGNAATGAIADGYPELFLDLNNNLEIDTQDHTFYVDAVNNRVGIKTTSPAYELDVNGNVNATTFLGALTGNASTASALAANGGNCAAGSYPLGVDASGATESCTDATTEINTEIGNVLDGTDTFTDFTGTVLDSDNYVNGSIDDAHHAADSITHTSIADTDQQDTKCVYWENPVDTDDFKSVWTTNGFAATITKMWCESDQTVNMDLQIDDGTPADVAGTDLVCDSTPAEVEAGLTGSMADGNRLDFIITSVSGTPTWCSMCWTFQFDD